MLLRLERQPSTELATAGKLYIDGEYFCHTLEDVIRAGEKVFGKTAIPPGNYEVVINHSPHFDKDLPLLLNVENFSGVRIHAGNSADDSEGCILIGLSASLNRVAMSQLAMATFMPKLRAGLAAGPVFISIINPGAP